MGGGRAGCATALGSNGIVAPWRSRSPGVLGNTPIGEEARASWRLGDHDMLHAAHVRGQVTLEQGHRGALRSRMGCRAGCATALGSKGVVAPWRSRVAELVQLAIREELEARASWRPGDHEEGEDTMAGDGVTGG